MNKTRVSCFAALVALSACAHSPAKPALSPYVDISRFMGDWHVIASIPLSTEKNSHNAVESYRLDSSGRILTTYTFNEGRFNGPLKSYHPVGTVYNRATHAEWRMQFLWPFKSAYLIHEVAPDYSTTIVGDSHLSHVWIMARAAHLDSHTYAALVRRVADLGYDTTQLRLVPQT